MPYTYKKQGDKYVVYKKSTGKKVGTTAGNKTALKKYMAALHIHEPKKESKKPMKENMDYENKVGSMHMVQKPYDGCSMETLVYEIDPITGIQQHGVDAQTVHGIYPTPEEAQKVAEKLYNEHMGAMKKLEEKKGKVATKLTSAITKLEKKHKDLMEMAKANPKEAATHKAAISEIQAKIQELMDKLEMVEKSKKPIETEEEKKPLKENEGGDLETLKSLLDAHDWFYTFSDDPRVYSKGTQEIEQIRSMAKQLGDEGIKMYVMKFKQKFPNANVERLMQSMKGIDEAFEADYGKWEYLADMVEDAMFAWLEAHDYELGDDAQIETDAEELTSKIVSKYINSAYTNH
jgi:hypothetical protein